MKKIILLLFTIILLSGCYKETNPQRFKGAVVVNKTYENCICGHTHSPEIREKTFYVGTLSKLIVNYNQKGMTQWAHANTIIHENGTAQIILL